MRPRTGRGSSLSFTPARGEKVHSRVIACASVAEGEVKWVGNKRKVDLNKSYYPKKEDTDKQKKVWYVIDAEGKTLGRLAVSTRPESFRTPSIVFPFFLTRFSSCRAQTLVSMYLRGKHLPTYTPSMDMGGYAVVHKQIILKGKITVHLRGRWG